MSHIFRSAKSGSDWTSSELNAYHIVVRNQSPKSFYVDPGFLNSDAASENTSDKTHRLLIFLDLATKANAGQESAIHDFAKELLHTSRSAQIDICLRNHALIILLVVQQEEIELKAVAAFQRNNYNRAQIGLEMKDYMSIPAITTGGTRPIFYIIPVTQELSTAVERGEYPEHLTEVKKYVVGDRRRLGEGMNNPDFRLEALKHYSLFLPLATSLWSEFLVE
ncbi:hypothetical protein CPB83DRAFT_875338 [Crepidotus variabilis]|uniref:Uncharacterized protein n=1 Tax=Crepidotus variabilis TaxID=179855 RepID=A0A9P6EJ21_9AGAR|nr:hypothetical protein CPB83DRAFT_875338 [Crepidotus variabilis]